MAQRSYYLTRLFALSLAALGVLSLGSFGWNRFNLPAFGELLDPLEGVFHTARHAAHENQTLQLKGIAQSVQIKRDNRGVPHIFAQNDADAIRAVGFVTAQDRLFQLDFLPRVSQGQLSEVLGSKFIERDKMLRRTGMEWGARKNLAWLKQNEPQQIEILEQFCEGVNAYIDQMKEADLPLEFRLLNYTPRRCQPINTLRMLQYMNYDLSWKSDDMVYGEIRKAIGDSAFVKLYPQFSPMYVPISPEERGITPAARGVFGRTNNETQGTIPVAPPVTPPDSLGNNAADLWMKWQSEMEHSFLEGHIEGKGSNNWAVSGTRSNTGLPILAGDPHLRVSFPSIWYEMHVVTPNMNSYGVAVPGSPLPIIGFNQDLAWTFTNTDIDQIDFYKLTLDRSKKKYKYMDRWRDLESVVDTIRVKNGDVIIDTLQYAHWGPVLEEKGDAVAVQWTAHQPNRIMSAVWGFHHAKNMDQFQQALQKFDAPMQNCLYADRFGNIAIRSSGNFPIRKGNFAGGLLDGSADAGEWIGRVPFNEYPSSWNPDQGFLTSTNQQPAPPDYPYYQRVTWRDSYRSIRIDSLLRGKAKHDVEDFKAYQRDVYAVQWDLLKPFVMSDSLKNISDKAKKVRDLLKDWKNETTTSGKEPLVLDVLLKSLKSLMWDEFKAHKNWRLPELSTITTLLREAPRDKWFDVKNTSATEDGYTILAKALEATSDSLAQRYSNVDTKWGAQHQIRFNHILETLKPLGRGPFPFSGFENTLSPAANRLTMNTASWRMIVDFEGGKPKGYGVFPGGASGNPFSPFYDYNLQTFLDFDYFDLDMAAKYEDVALTSSTLTLMP